MKKGFIMQQPISYQKITGAFNFEAVYQAAVNHASDGANFLEIGCWYGCSTIYLAELIKISGKKIKLHVIDTFDGAGNSVPNEVNQEKAFIQNVKDADVTDIIEIHKGTSDSVFDSGCFDKDFFDFVFIDGSHEYEDVKNDINNSLETTKPDGIVAGHDYQHPPVRKAVDELLDNLLFHQNSWIYNVPN